MPNYQNSWWAGPCFPGNECWSCRLLTISANPLKWFTSSNSYIHTIVILDSEFRLGSLGTISDTRGMATFVWVWHVTWHFTVFSYAIVVFIHHTRTVVAFIELNGECLKWSNLLAAQSLNLEKVKKGPVSCTISHQQSSSITYGLWWEHIAVEKISRPHVMYVKFEQQVMWLIESIASISCVRN